MGYSTNHNYFQLIIRRLDQDREKLKTVEDLVNFQFNYWPLREPENCHVNPVIPASKMLIFSSSNYRSAQPAKSSWKSKKCNYWRAQEREKLIIVKT